MQAQVDPSTRWRRARRWWRQRHLALRLAAWAVLATPLVAWMGLRLLFWLAPLPDEYLALSGQPLRVYDRHGELIGELRGVASGTPSLVAEVPALAVAAVIQAEDQTFWEHPGLAAHGIARAAYLNLRHGRLAYGGSTLTQQVARLRTSPNGRRTLARKLREAVLALRIDHQFDKHTQLSYWLTRACYGDGIYGFHDAAQAYFGRPPSALTVGEATLLAILPRSPEGYAPRRHLARAMARRDHVLRLLVQRGLMSPTAYAEALAQPIELVPSAPNPNVELARWLVADLPPDVRRRGGEVRTTLDLPLQRELSHHLTAHATRMQARGLTEAAVVVVAPRSGELLAMVGHTQGGGSAINMATWRRYPGSTLKPFVYALALEAGDTPASIAWDVRDTHPDYVTHAGVEHGPVRYRDALASSFNFAAIDVLGRHGIGALMTLLRNAGVSAASQGEDVYGLRLALGSSKVRLVDLVTGYGWLVNQGQVSPRVMVKEIITPQASGASVRWTPPHQPALPVVTPTTAWLIMDMLSDPTARRPGFGDELPFDLPFRVAAKTGTARGFADTWAVAATEQYLVGAWAGNLDGKPMQAVVGMSGAAPIVRDALLALARRRQLTLPPRPAHLVTQHVCSISGMRAGPHCPRQREVFAPNHTPQAPCSWHDHAGTLTYPERAQGWRQRVQQARPHP